MMKVFRLGSRWLLLFYCRVQVRSLESRSCSLLPSPALRRLSVCFGLLTGDGGVVGRNCPGVRGSTFSQPESRGRHDRVAPHSRGGNSLQPRAEGRAQEPEALHVHGEKK